MSNSQVISKDILGEDIHMIDIPRYAIWCGYRVRVLDYLGGGMFRVLDRYDGSIRVHRNALRFLPDRSPSTATTP